jgi:hypothetical protein
LRWCTWNGGPTLGRVCYGDWISADHYFPDGTWFEIQVPAVNAWMPVTKAASDTCSHGRDWPEPGSINARTFLNCMANVLAAASPQWVAAKKASDEAAAKAAAAADKAAKDAFIKQDEDRKAAFAKQLPWVAKALSQTPAQLDANHDEECKEEKARALKTSGLVSTVLCQ